MSEIDPQRLPHLGQRRLRDRRGDGAVVAFEDSSEWDVYPGHEIFTTHWDPDTPIVVVPGSYPDYPYDLINTVSGDRVPARYRGSVRAAGTWRLLDH